MKELQIFFTAIMFYTRIPCPKWVDHDPEFINQSIRYFPIIGWIAGLVAFSGYFLGFIVEGPVLGVIISLIFSVLLTGAFHEDGFADVCDGFGGGWTKKKILIIMKDSRIGAYGAIGLILMILLKATLMNTVFSSNSDWLWVLLIFILAHTLSRFMASTFVYTHSYVRDDSTGMNKPVVKKSNPVNLVLSAFYTAIPFGAFVFYFGWDILMLIPATYIVKWLLGRYFFKWIGGYTGDCLGATQQIAEVSFYLFALLLWKFI